MKRNRVVLISDVFYPEVSGTGYYATAIAKELQKTCQVSVFTAQPTNAAHGRRLPSCEELDGVEIRRLWATNFHKDRLLGRLINQCTFSLTVMLRLLLSARKVDLIFAYSNPVSAPWIAAAVARLTRTPLVVRVDDRYFDMLAGMGKLKANGLVHRAVKALDRFAYSSASTVMTLGRDMVASVQSDLPASGHHIVQLSPNWTDPMDESAMLSGPDKARARREFGWDEDEVVIVNGGNLGLFNEFATVLDAMSKLDPMHRVRLVFVGSGVRDKEVRRASSRLQGVEVRSRMSRSDFWKLQQCADISLITLASGTLGGAVPSRTYNSLAAGLPLLAVVPANSEVDLTIREEGVGWSFRPGAVSELASFLQVLNRQELRARGFPERCRTLARRRFSADACLPAVVQAVSRSGGAGCLFDPVTKHQRPS